MDPMAIARPARLANIVNCKAQALQLEADIQFMQAAQSKAEGDLQQVLGYRGWDFCPFVVSPFGLVGPAAFEIFNTLIARLTENLPPFP